MKLWTRLCAIAAAAGLTACGMGSLIMRGDAVEITEVGRSVLCTAEDENARVQYFESADAVAAWERRTGIQLGGGQPLPFGRYALIEMGQRHTGGYGIAASREGERRGSALRVYTTFFSPGAGAMTVQMITSPCVLVRLPAGDDRRIEVYDQTGTLRASTEVAGS